MRSQRLEQQTALKYFAHYQTGLTLLWLGLLTWFELALAMHIPLLLWALWLPLQILLTWLLYRLLYRVYKAKIELSNRRWFIILSVSSALLTGLLYHTGGVINPLSFLLLVPLAFGSMLLNRHYLFILALLSALLFFGLSQFYVPLMSLKITSLNYFFYWHLNGSVAIFIILTLLVITFISPLKKQLDSARESTRKLQKQAIQDEYLLSLATLAAASVHQLSTPLNSLSLIESLLRSSPSDAEQKEYLDMMSAQIKTCDQVLKQLRKQADLNTQNQLETVNINEFLQTLRQEFALLHPQSELTLLSGIDGQFTLPPGFKLALFNLLNNAARHSPDFIGLSTYLTTEHFIVEVEDRGDGIPLETQAKLGRQPIDQAEEMGIGIYLTQILMERCQAQLSYHPLKQGTLARLTFNKGLFKQDTNE